MTNIHEQPFETKTIKSAERTEDGGYSLEFEDGSGLFTVGLEDYLPAPEPGARADLYGRGVGYPVRGVVIDGVVYSYRTEEEYQADAAKLRRDEADRRRVEWEANRGRNESRIGALPDQFRERFRRFERRDEAWGPEFGPYELMVCEQAVLMVRELGDLDAITTFVEADHDRQRVLLPGLDEGHSGNSFHCAVMLARTYLTEPDMLPKMHGALCPLAGCEAYGCFAAYPDA